MEDVNHKYPNTAIPIAIIIIVIIPMVFALFINARKVIEIKRQYSKPSTKAHLQHLHKPRFRTCP